MKNFEQQNLYGFEFRDLDHRRSENRQTYDIKQMWQRTHEIVNLAARGYKYVEIAEILGITPQTVSNTLNGELGKSKLSEIRLERDNEAKKISEKIRVLTNKALQTYHELFDNESGELSIKDRGSFASEFLKEISGLRAPLRVQSQSLAIQLTKEDIEEFKARGKKAIEAIETRQNAILPCAPSNDNNKDFVDNKVLTEQTSFAF